MTLRGGLPFFLVVSILVHLVIIGTGEVVSRGGGDAGKKEPFQVEYRGGEESRDEVGEDREEPRSADAISLESADPRQRPYLQKVRQGIAENWGEPEVQKGEKTAGTLQVEFTIGKDGRLTAVSVVKSSGVRGLDFAAVDAVKKAAPFPSLPKDSGGKDLTVSALFVYD